MEYNCIICLLPYIPDSKTFVNLLKTCKTAYKAFENRDLLKFRHGYYEHSTEYSTQIHCYRDGIKVYTGNFDNVSGKRCGMFEWKSTTLNKNKEFICYYKYNKIDGKCVLSDKTSVIIKNEIWPSRPRYYNLSFNYYNYKGPGQTSFHDDINRLNRYTDQAIIWRSKSVLPLPKNYTHGKTIYTQIKI